MMRRAGFARVDLTPGGRCDLNGFAARKQPALGVAAPVLGRVLMLSIGRWKGLIAACDLLALSIDDAIRIETQMARAAGCAVKNVLLTCTHTHSAPVAMPLGVVGHFARRYVDQLARKLAGAARSAREDLAPVSGIRLGRASAEGLGEFRCAQSEPGRDHWAGDVTVIHIERDDAPPVSVMHLGVHAYVLGAQNRRVHPDYPGVTCELLARKTGGRTLFLPGCGADVSPVPGMTGSFAKVERYARRLTARALDALATGRRIDFEPARSAMAGPRIRFGFHPPETEWADNWEEVAKKALSAAGRKVVRNERQYCAGLRDGRWPERIPLRTHIMRFGPLMLIGMPAELFYDTGADIAKALRPMQALTVSQAGGDVGYLARPFAHRHLTYETTSAHKWYRTAGAVLPGEEEKARKAVVRKAKRMLLRG